MARVGRRQTTRSRLLSRPTPRRHPWARVPRLPRLPHIRGSQRVLLGALAVTLLVLAMTPPDATAQEERPEARAVLTISPLAGPVTTTFTGQATQSQGSLIPEEDRRADIVLYEWDWEGDGTFVEDGGYAFHQYEEDGQYRVTVRVTDETGATAEASRTVTVGEPSTGFQWHLVTDNYELYLLGAKLTLQLSAIAILAGLPLGIIVGLLRITRFPPVRWVATAYIEFLRGTPLLVQIFIVVFALPDIGINLTAFQGGAVALTINSSAYLAEIIRSGIQAIPSGQLEAAYAMGLSYPQAMRFIILPQALRLVIPPITNEFIILTKDSSLVSLIGLLELMGWARVIGNRAYRYLEPFIAVAVMYFVITYSLSLFLQWVERRLAIPGLGMGGPKGEH